MSFSVIPLVDIEIYYQFHFQLVSRATSPALAQERMLRKVLLKAVENLRQNQRRQQGKEGVQEEEELQLQSQPQVEHPEQTETEAQKEPGKNLEDLFPNSKRFTSVTIPKEPEKDLEGNLD